MKRLPVAIPLASPAPAAPVEAIVSAMATTSLTTDASSRVAGSTSTVAPSTTADAIDDEAEEAALWAAEQLRKSNLAKGVQSWSSQVIVEYNGQRYIEFKDMPLPVLRYFIYLMKEGVPAVKIGFDDTYLQSDQWIKGLEWTERECLRALVFLKKKDFKPHKPYPLDKSHKKAFGHIFVPTGKLLKQKKEMYGDCYALRLSFVLYPTVHL